MSDDFNKLKPFRFWCQKVLPLVYDNSLSYYELLCKVVDYLNHTIEDVNAVIDLTETFTAEQTAAYAQFTADINATVAGLTSAFNTLQTFVNNYFDNLDVQQEIDNKLDLMASDGTLSAMVRPVAAAMIPGLVSQWLEDNITPTTPAVDKTLTVVGAAADARETGYRLAWVSDSYSWTDNSYYGLVGTYAGQPVTDDTYARTARVKGTIDEIIGVRSFPSVPGGSAVLFWRNGVYVGFFIYDSTGGTAGYHYLTPEGTLTTAIDHDEYAINWRKNYDYPNWDWVMRRAKLASDVTGLKDDLNQITSVDYLSNPGYIGASGSIGTQSSTKEVYTNPIHVLPLQKITLSLKFTDRISAWAAFASYDANGDFLTRTVLINDTQLTEYKQTIVVPDNAYYIAFTYRTYDICTAKIYSLLPITKAYATLVDDIKDLDTTTQEQQSQINTISKTGITLNDTDLQQADIVDGQPVESTARLSNINPFYVIPGIAVSYNTTGNMYIAVVVYDANGTKIEDSGWLGGDAVDGSYTVKKAGIMFTKFRRASGVVITTTNYKNWGAVTTIHNAVDDYKKILSENMSGENIDNLNGVAYFGLQQLNIKPVYDHLFVNQGTDAIIPHESVYHVRVSKRLGFNVIEANIAKTSDNVYIVNHLQNGAFGAYFHHADGVTSIADILVSSVTWNWIVANVRYNSAIPKYRTRPCRLEEFLSECKQQGIIPFIYGADSAVVEIANAYMGKDNYIIYDGTRDVSSTAIIYHWKNLTTKAAILNYCRQIGKPFIYGMANPTAFTTIDLQDIVKSLHAEGFLIGTSYADTTWYKYSSIGFDILGSQRMVNRIAYGNVCNIDTIYGFSGYVYTNATEAGGILTFLANGTLTPDIPADTVDIGAADLQMVFNGEITISSFGQFGSQTYTSDGAIPFFVTTPLIGKTPKITINVSASTVITECTYRVFRC